MEKKRIKICDESCVREGEVWQLQKNLNFGAFQKWDQVHRISSSASPYS